MLDHVLGRPSVKSRRLQVLAVLVFWLTYLARGNKNGPLGTRTLSRLLSKKLTAWQMVVLTMTYLYTARNFSTLVGLASPDPLSNMYDATFFRATWVLTALDAGFWTAMKIRSRWLRDIAGIVFSGFYLVAAEQADEKVRKVRGNLTVEHLRVSWNKGTTPYLNFIQGLTRPRLTRWPPRYIRIPRPATSDYKDQPVMAWLYYDGSIDHLRASGINRVILDIPGGGFVAMDPRCNDDRLFTWAVHTGLPVLSLDYRKAPEHPFPYALYECYDVYSTLVNTRGRCIGMAGKEPAHIVMSGDSAGGNLATATTLMIAQSAPTLLSMHERKDAGNGQEQEQDQQQLPLPEGLILTYPALDMNIGSWMSDEQMALIQDRRMRATNKNVIRRKTSQYNDIAGTPHESGDEALVMTSMARAEADGSDGDDDDSSEDDEEKAQSQGEDARRPKPAYSHVNMAKFGKTLQARPRTPRGDASSTSGGVQPITPMESTLLVAGPVPAPALQTRLTTSSTISYFNDRVLTPEMMRAMIILYVGPHSRPDFARDYLLSPILAPDLLLARFPKTYFLTGERDPLVDDTVIFAGRLRRIQAALCASGGRRLEYRESDADVLAKMGFDDRDVAEVVLVPGVSHGFLQFPAIYPPARGWFERTAHWIEDVFKHAETRRASSGLSAVRGRGRGRGRVHAERGDKAGKVEKAGQTGQVETVQTVPNVTGGNGSGTHAKTESSGDDEGPLEMMRMTKAKGPAKTDNSNGGGSPAPEEEQPFRESSTTLVEGTNAGSASTKKKRGKTARPRGGSSSSNGDRELVKLASSDDLLGRRMQGIVGGLTGVTEE
ncbi:hormone-sensitive lipase [Grosmannia clavigera kw1407]|uniref:Hormone-sensitive lipase n=1 Tax=Grosmannia clavigera (strain kw1407 / UAMH 11150) TaxID=655863 RepID=F0X713_GROCL|nr:hormone-sensitive lipase [Grosmannia clavigera kw1407]EFX06385.1 hormone-sensitive lipase [Grosmannia clavigera kw1407]